MLRNFFLSMLFCVFLFGCTMPPSQADLDSAYYGEFPDNYEQIVVQYMGRVLKDPESARYSFGPRPIQNHVYIWRGLVGGLVAGNTLEFGWVGVVEINAKNSYGGYAGASGYTYLIRDGSVVLLQKHLQ